MLPGSKSNDYMKNDKEPRWNNDLIELEIHRISSMFVEPRMPSKRDLIEIEGNYSLVNAIARSGQIQVEMGDKTIYEKYRDAYNLLWKLDKFYESLI